MFRYRASILFFACIALFLGVASADIVLANSAPVWSSQPTKAVFTGQLLEFAVFAQDPDGDGLTYSVTNLPSGAAFNPVLRKFSWQPTSGQTGTYTVIFRAFDGFNSADMNVLIMVNSGGATNPTFTGFATAPPFFTPINFTQPSGPPTFLNFNPPGTAREGQLYTYTVQAFSVVSFPVTYRLISGPEGMTINPSLGIILWLPNFSQGRPEPYIVVVGAATGQYEASRSFNIYVEDVTQTSTSTPPIVYTPPVVFPPPVIVPPATVTPPPAPAPLRISNIGVTYEENGDVTVSWDTNKKARSRVIYDTKSQADKTEDFTYKNATPDPDSEKPENFLTHHSIKLTGLRGGMKYYFRAVSKTNGEVVVSDEMTFETPRRPLALLSELAEFFTNPWLYILAALGAIIWFFVYRSRKKKERLIAQPKVVI